MATFKEFMNLAQITVKDNTSPKRMEEIIHIMRENQVTKGLTPQKAVTILEELGPTSVKIGQLASSRSDLLPADYCKAFEKLQANVTPLSYETVLQCIDEAYGKSWKTVFASIEEKPLGSASIAQVHKATLLDGTVVAVKVRRPGIVKQMAEDITMMKHILAWGEFAVPSQQSTMLNLESFVNELERTTENEVDFTIELHNLVRFHQDIADQPGISSPKPYPHISSDSVLVMEYIQGFEVDDLARRREAAQGDDGEAKASSKKTKDRSFSVKETIPTGIDASVAVGDGIEATAKPTGAMDVMAEFTESDGVKVKLNAVDDAEIGKDPAFDPNAPVDPETIDLPSIARRLVQSYVTQVLDNGFFHADPHPGNIIIRGNEIVWIDLGMVGTLTAGERALVNQMFHAVTANNAYELKDAVLSLSVAHGPVDQGKLLSRMASLLQKYGSADLSDINIGTLMEEVIEVLRVQNLVVSPSITMLARGVVTIEGVMAEIAPDTNVLQVVSNHVIRQELSRQSTESRLLSMAAASAESAEAMTKLPRQLSDVLQMLGRGEITIVGDMRVENSALETLYAIAGRLSLAVIAVGLFMGSSILCTTDMDPKFLGVPLLGVFGFIGAFVLSVYVIVRVMQSRHAMINNEKPK